MHTTIAEHSGQFDGLGGIPLHYHVWEPEAPRGTMVLVHGLNEHLGRYLHVADYFVRQGLTVWALDQRGYGRSGGVRCYVDRFEDYLHDLHLFVAMASGRGTPIMVGHSMGGLIAFRYAVTYPDTIRGLVLSSPMFGVRVKAKPLERFLAPVIAKLLPRLQMGGGAIGPGDITRNTDVIRRDAADPLLHNKVTPRWYVECLRVIEASHREVGERLRLPTLFLQAGADRLVDPEATRQIYERVSHDRKRFVLYPDKFHEVFNDPGHDEVFAEILQWLGQEELILGM